MYGNQLLEFKKIKGSAQLETFKNISLDIFNQIRDGLIQQKRKMKIFTVWSIRPSSVSSLGNSGRG